MGIKTFTTFQSDLVLALSNRNDTDISSRKAGWINTAYITLASKNKIPGTTRKFSLPDLETDTGVEEDNQVTADGTKYILAPANCLYIQNVEDTTNDVRLTRKAWKDYINTTGRNDSDSRGEPTEYCRRGVNSDKKKYVYLLPTPDSVYGMTIYYRKYPNILVNDTDTTVIGAEWDEIILQIAIAQSLARLKLYEESKQEGEILSDMLKDIVGIYDNEDFDTDDEIQPESSITERCIY